MTRAAAGLVPLVALLTACSSLLPGGTAPAADPTTTGTPAPLPARPRELPLTGLDPCTVLTDQQLDELGVGNPRAGVSPDEFASQQCLWSRFPAEPQDYYLVRLAVGRDARDALRSTTGATVRDVAGFAAVETVSPESLPERNCVLFVDVAAGESMIVVYDYLGTTVPMTTALACEKARTAAGLMARTLQALR